MVFLQAPLENDAPPSTVTSAGTSPGVGVVMLFGAFFLFGAPFVAGNMFMDFRIANSRRVLAEKSKAEGGGVGENPGAR